jgi:phosphatidylinositol-3-phosphatase
VCRRALIALLLVPALAGCGAASAGRPIAVGRVASLPVSRGSHVAIVVMENAEYGEVIGSHAAPYVNALARRYGLATASYAITHPSLPNYIALISGGTHGIDSDCTSCSVAGENLATQAERAGVSWRAYLEDLPRPCFGGASAGAYAKKHNPFAYFRNIASDGRMCEREVGFGALAADLRAGTLPSLVWISPNLCDDGHDCALSTADRFLARTLPAVIRELGPHGFLILTWDEGTTDAGCCGTAAGGHIATIVAGPDVRGGARSASPLDDYGVLATIEDALGLPRLGGARDPRAGSLASLFARTPRLR